MKSFVHHFAIAAVYLAIASSNAALAGSIFINVNSVNESKYGIKVQVAPRQNQQHLYQVKAPMVGEHMHCWLIVSKKKLRPKQRCFRDYIWYGASERSDILLKARLVPTKEADLPPTPHKDLLLPTRKREAGKEVYIQFTVHKDLVSQSYVYIDFPNFVLDGGGHYAIDLASYLNRSEKR
ncbi:MAG: hypothetical protein ACYSWO_09490 [Planctomycetota bacterium]